MSNLENNPSATKPQPGFRPIAEFMNEHFPMPSNSSSVVYCAEGWITIVKAPDLPIDDPDIRALSLDRPLTTLRSWLKSVTERVPEWDIPVEKLRRELEAGRITAWGKRPDSADRTPIPAADWRHLRLDYLDRLVAKGGAGTVRDLELAYSNAEPKKHRRGAPGKLTESQWAKALDRRRDHPKQSHIEIARSFLADHPEVDMNPQTLADKLGRSVAKQKPDTP